MHTVPQTFGRRELTLDEAEFAVIGIPYDSSESYRTGSRLGPGAIREASRDLEDYDMEEGFDLLSLRICDVGDVEVSQGDFDETAKRAAEAVREVLERGVTPLCLGGEHTITYFAARALEKKAAYIIFDAHLDYREDYIGNRFSHAASTRRLAELVGAGNILVAGVRSASKEELDAAEKDGLRYIAASQFHEDIEEACRQIAEHVEGREVYLSIDLDVVDPGEAPGVCNPEPGGISYRDAVKAFRFLRGSRLLGADLCEVSPVYDLYTPVLAAKLLFKALAIYRG